MVVKIGRVFIRFAIPVAAAVVFCGSTLTASAAGLSIIRDAEAENTIRAYATPVLRAAGLEPESVRIHIVRDNRLNAFVANGQRIFITTGLLKAAETPGQLTGVLAHEIGHIAGGHLARLQGALREAQNQVLIGSIAALLAGVASGNAGAAAAGTTGASHVATRLLLRYTRGHEQAADQAALQYLDATGQSSRGMLDFLETLANQELLVVSDRTQRENRYDVTHPGTRERVAFVRNHVERSKLSDVPADPKRLAWHRRIVAKLEGFTDPPGRTLRKYRRTDRSISGRYARAIAYYRIPNSDAALQILDGLIKERPADPYFWELKGQILTESGRLEEALPAYDRAVALLPKSSLLRISQAHVQLELNRPKLVKPALESLKAAIRQDPRMPFAWRLAATAYHRLGRQGMTQLAFAEYNLLLGRRKEARQAATRAKKALKRGSREWQRADDILLAAGKSPGERPKRGKSRRGRG